MYGCAFQKGSKCRGLKRHHNQKRSARCGNVVIARPSQVQNVRAAVGKQGDRQQTPEHRPGTDIQPMPGQCHTQGEQRQVAEKLGLPR